MKPKEEKEVLGILEQSKILNPITTEKLTKEKMCNIHGFNCDNCDIRCLSNKNPKLSKFDNNWLKEH